jgi:hypothetical protein
MQARWWQAPVPRPGQLKELTVIVEGVASINGFAAAQRRMQHLVFGPAPARIEGGPEHRSSEMTQTTGQRAEGMIENLGRECEGTLN